MNGLLKRRCSVPLSVSALGSDKKARRGCGTSTPSPFCSESERKETLQRRVAFSGSWPLKERGLLINRNDAVGLCL